MTCKQALGAYTREPMPSGTGLQKIVSQLEIGKKVCFDVRAKNLLGTSEASAQETCISVAAELKFRCGAGTRLKDPTKFECVACEIGFFSPSAGQGCSKCEGGTYTPQQSGTACLKCKDRKVSRH